MSSEMLTTVTYTPDSRTKTNWFATWGEMFRNMWKSRELIYQLFRRDFLMAYKKSFLGVSWILIAPFMGIVSWVFMNATGILTPGDVGILMKHMCLLALLFGDYLWVSMELQQVPWVRERIYYASKLSS
jgi:hypothetical protein